MPIKPGWKTTEFWTALVSQALALLTVLGFVTSGDADKLEHALGQTIAAVFLFLSNAWIVVQYIRGRTEVKTQSPAKPFVAKQVLLVLLLLFGGHSVSHADTATTRVLLPWRAQMEQRMKQQERLIEILLQRLQQSPQPIVAPGPLRQLPIGGEPKQQLPIGGQPKQELPIGGAPKQALPIDGEPQQNLPPGGQPLQPLPIQPQTGPQTYSSFIRALYRR